MEIVQRVVGDRDIRSTRSCAEHQPSVHCLACDGANRTLRMERDLLKKRRSSCQRRRAGSVTDVLRFIDAKKTSFRIAFMCRRLGVSTAGYFPLAEAATIGASHR